MDLGQSSLYLYFLVTVFGFCLSDTDPVNTNDQNHLTSCFTRTVAFQTEGVRSLIVGRKLRTFCVYPNIRRSKMHTLTYIYFQIIMNSADVESKPDPRKPKYPCQMCEKAVTWKQSGVACDDCQQWYHVDCMHMSTPVYESLNHVNNWKF